MPNKNDGGPAFPYEDVKERYSNGCISKWNNYRGMSLRDYFAAKANEYDVKYYMKELKSIKGGIDEYIYRSREQARYAFADAMLEAREK